MPELTQQRLLEPEPTRVVRTHGFYVWGCDPSTLRLSVAWEPAYGMPKTLRSGVDTRSFERVTGDPAKRLSLIWRDTVDFVHLLIPKAPPGFVFMEQPSGKTPNLEFVQAVGVISAALHTALWHYAERTRVEYVPPSTWKKVACGAGNLYKPKRAAGGAPPAFEDYPVAVWARENGYAGSSWDECDATGIAVAARRTVRFQP